MDCLQWFYLITGIIGVVAFLMVIPSLFHIWGKPKIKVSWDSAHGNRLTCWIRNMPLNRFLAFFNVVRRQTELTPMITIDDQNNTPIHLLHYASRVTDDLRLVIAEVQTHKVYPKDEDGKPAIAPIMAGLYRATLELWGDGRTLKKECILFRVNQSAPFIQLS